MFAAVGTFQAKAWWRRCVDSLLEERQLRFAACVHAFLLGEDELEFGLEVVVLERQPAHLGAMGGSHRAYRRTQLRYQIGVSMSLRYLQLCGDIRQANLFVVIQADLPSCCPHPDPFLSRFNLKPALVVYVVDKRHPTAFPSHSVEGILQVTVKRRWHAEEMGERKVKQRLDQKDGGAEGVGWGMWVCRGVDACREEIFLVECECMCQPIP